MERADKMKMEKSNKDDHLFYYFNAKNEKRWCYRYRYYDEFGKRREASKQGFKSESEAYRMLLKVKSSILDGEIKEIESTNLTISKWFDIWMETNRDQWKTPTIKARVFTIENHIKPLLGNIKINNLDAATYKKKFINKLLDKLTPSTVHAYHTIFKIGINAAVENEIIKKNRFKKVKIRKDNPSTLIVDNFYTAEQLSIFLEGAQALKSISHYTALLILASTGMRKGEALGLTWKDIDFNKFRITINKTRDYDGLRPPKTNNSYRTIKVGGKVINQLKLYQKWCKELKLSFGQPLKEEDFILISRTSGKPISPNSLNYAVNTVADNQKLKKITVHGLRHTHATILISKRIPVKVIADRLGNSPQMINDIYSHTFEELEIESVEVFEEAMNL